MLVLHAFVSLHGAQRVEMTLEDIAKRIKCEVLNYEAERHLPLLDYRLKVLQYNTKDFSIKSKLVYSCLDINEALDLSLEELERCFQITKFQNENHKINTILLIITKNIANGAERCAKRQESVEKISKLDNTCLHLDKQDYTPKCGKLKNEELWE